LFVAVTRSETGRCDTCIVSHWSSPPKDSWYKNQQVAVRIDDAWTDPIARGYFQQGIEKWNQADNCSGVNFHDFSAIHFASYPTDAPPDFTMWWQKTSPLGVRYFYTFPGYLQRLRAVIVPIFPSFRT